MYRKVIFYFHYIELENKKNKISSKVVLLILLDLIMYIIYTILYNCIHETKLKIKK